MASLSTVTKYSFKYNVQQNDETVNRTIGGLNISGNSSSSADLGPNVGAAISNLYNTLSSFTSGTISGAKWLTEREVVL